MGGGAVGRGSAAEKFNDVMLAGSGNEDNNGSRTGASH